MYSFFILGIIPGTNIKITFTVWCFFMTALLTVWYNYRKNPHFKAFINLYAAKLYLKTAPLTKHELITNITGNKGLPVQFEILEQDLALRVRSFTRQLLQTLKIKR
jgi:hypothetical protein